jgi:hypothetical protein
MNAIHRCQGFITIISLLSTLRTNVWLHGTITIMLYSHDFYQYTKN